MLVLIPPVDDSQDSKEEEGDDGQEQTNDETNMPAAAFKIPDGTTRILNTVMMLSPCCTLGLLSLLHNSRPPLFLFPVFLPVSPPVSGWFTGSVSDSFRFLR